jgi:hypothetical protein
VTALRLPAVPVVSTKELHPTKQRSGETSLRPLMRLAED